MGGRASFRDRKSTRLNSSHANTSTRPLSLHDALPIFAAIRENIAHKERGKKAPALPLERLQEFWRNQLDQHERLDLIPPAAGAKPPVAANAEEAVSWAEEHLFEIGRAHV